MAPAGFRIIKIDEEMSFDEAGKVRTRVRVAWRTDTDGPFVDYFAKETYEPITARIDLEGKANAIHALRG